MACLELDGRILIIDVGPVLPVRRHARDRPGPAGLRASSASSADRLQAVVLTHGHEDHVGALPYLLRDIGPPTPGLRHGVHAGAAAGQARGARGHGPRRARRRSRRARQATVGPVHDALPPGHALDPRRDGGRDRHPVRHRPAHRRLQDRPDADRRAADRPPRARRGGRARQACICSSRTPRTPRSPGYTVSERTVGPVLRDIVAQAPGAGRRGLLLEPHPPRSSRS